MRTEPEEIVGRWTLERRVVDRRVGLRGRVHGTLEVTGSADGGYRWSERGELVLPAHRAPVTRVNLIARVDGDWWVLFEDGRPFHPWRPGEQVVHPCAADVYDGRVVLDRAGTRLRTLWDVHGPTKDQRLITRFTRIDPAAHPA